MSDYPNHLRKAQKHLSDHFYESAIMECGRILESGLKQLYRDLEEYCVQKGLQEEFKKLQHDFFRKRKKDFDIRKAGLGGMILFSEHKKFWVIVKRMCDSNLSFMPMINWTRVRELRNKSTHNIGIHDRNESVEMMFYTKVFLFDTGLMDTGANPTPDLLDLRCLHCQGAVNRDFHFCPQCGKHLEHHCHGCGKQLLPQHRICPHCDMKRMKPENQNKATDTYRKYAEAVWADWEVTPGEKEWLEQKRLELGLSPEEADRIEISIIPKNYHDFMNLIEAVNLDGVIDDDERIFLLARAEEMGLTEMTAERLIDNAQNQTKRIRKRLLGVW